jgi:hypothetical protein
MDIRKRGRPEHGFNTNGGFKKSRQGLSFFLLALFNFFCYVAYTLNLYEF